MKPSPRIRRALATVAAIAWLAGACTGRGESDGRADLHVFAASSLTDAFGELATAFEEVNPDVDVVLNLAGSQVLRLQIEQGARADVYVSANEAHARALAVAGLADEGTTLAWNALVIIVPPDNPAGIASFADLPNAERLVIGSETVPIGIYTRMLLDRAEASLGADFAEAVRARVVSRESNVRLVRAKVELGEADAAIVYRTDAIDSDRVQVIAIPPGLAVRARYVIAAVRGEAAEGAQPDAAARFIAFARSPTGAAILERHGFDGADA
jgi:molybdate transport system substrate-binding protein